MGLADWLRPRILDRLMAPLDELRPETVGRAEGEVLELGFGTGRNLPYLPPSVKRLAAIDPKPGDGLPALEERVARAPFPVERFALRADGDLPFDAGRFDTVLATFTLCSIADPLRALREVRRVLAPGGRLLFLEHGRAPDPRTARWQDWLNPLWLRLTGECNMNRPMDRLVEEGGFELEALDRFRHRGPAVLAHMFRGVARPV